MDQLKQFTVSSRKIENNPSELSSISHRNCFFCNKMVDTEIQNRVNFFAFDEKKFYCPFCIRNNFNYTSSENVMIFSFRGIIGHLYYRHYMNGSGPKTMWLNEILSHCKNHELAGLDNPAFSYDKETYLWFADFNKIGENSYVSLENVLIDIENIFNCFKIHETFEKNTSDRMFEKYENAFQVFYEHRKRPSNQKMLIPTFKMSVSGSDVFFEKTRNFLPEMLKLKT